MAHEDYEKGWRAGHTEAQTWVLVLDRYQRDNLLSLINTLGFPYSNPIEPFNILNSGDWVGELAIMLAAPGTEAAFQMNAEKTGDPILTRDEVFRRLHEWLKGTR